MGRGSAYSGSGHDADNRANQLNDEHDAYWSSRASQGDDHDDDPGEQVGPRTREAEIRRTLARLIEFQQTTVLNPAKEAALEDEIVSLRREIVAREETSRGSLDPGKDGTSASA